MIGLVRATTVCALLVLVLVSAHAADKAFKRDDLADAAIKLESQIKSEAGPVTKNAATLRNDADAAFRRNDFRTGMAGLGQITGVAPKAAANWLRLAKAGLQLRPGNEQEGTPLLERPASAAYIAYQRTTAPAEE